MGVLESPWWLLGAAAVLGWMRYRLDGLVTVTGDRGRGIRRLTAAAVLLVAAIAAVAAAAALAFAWVQKWSYSQRYAGSGLES